MGDARPHFSVLPHAGRLYVAAVSLAGLGVVSHSAWAITTTDIDWHWILFAALTVLGGAITIKVPSLLALLSVSEMFAFTCVLLFGPAAGTLTLALDGVILSLRRKHRAHRALFNASELAISMWVSSHLFFTLAGVGPLYGQPLTLGTILLPVGAMAITYFVLNSGLVSTAIGLEFGQAPLTIWRQHFAWLVPNYLAGAAISLLLLVALQQAGLSAVALILPLLLLSYLTVRTSLGRVEDAERHVAKVDRLYLSTIETLATAIDAKDEVTHGHIRRVQMGAVGLARKLGVHDEATIKAIEAAALLHDTGKLAIPEHILNKPGKLTSDEFEVMKQHARIGAEILAPVDFPFPVLPIVRHHHENWDGTGYPDGISATDIPIGARILSVVDCFDALTSDRPYRRRMTDEAALTILLERKGSMYDPLVVDTFSAVYREIMPREEEAVSETVKPRLLDTPRSPAPSIPALTPASAAHAEDVLALTSLNRALSPEGAVTDTLALVWSCLRRVVPASMAGFYAIDSTGSVTLRHVCGAVPAGVQGLSIAAGHGVSGWVASNRRMMMNSEASLDLGSAALAAAPALQSCLSVPLFDGEALTGVLTLYADHPFDEEHGRLLQTVAPHIAGTLKLALSRSTAQLTGMIPATGTAGSPDSRRRSLRVISRR
jgi:putative nucleotidyltransferase with HDIG domain